MFKKSVLTLPAFLAGCSLAPGLIIEAEHEKVGAPTEVGGFDLIHVDGQVVSSYNSQTPRVFGTEGLPKISTKWFSDAQSGYEYTVGPGDVLSVIVWDHPELTSPTGEFREAASSGRLVDNTGKIFYPYVGELEVAGRSVTQIRRSISGNLSRVVRDPQVDVRVAAYRSKSVQVSGAVESPARIPITDRPLTVSEAISAAGGFDDGAFLASIILSRDGRDFQLEYIKSHGALSPSTETILQNGDAIHVLEGESQAVFVLGAVKRQGRLPLRYGTISLADVLSTAEGLDEERADSARVFIVRGSNSKTERERPTILVFDMSSLNSLLLAETFQVWPRDVVFVDKTGLSISNSVVSQLLPSVSTLFQLDRLILDD